MRLGRAAQAVIGFSVAGGVAFSALAAPGVTHLGWVSGGDWFVVGVVAALVVGSYIRPLVLFRGAQSEAYHLDEAFLVILLLLAPPVATIGTFFLATVVSQVVWRRPAIKAVFNVSQFLFAVGAATAVTQAISSPHRPLSVAALFAAAVGAIVFFLVNYGLLSAVLTAVGTPWRTSLLADVQVRLGLFGTGLLAGVLLAVTASDRTWTVVLAAPTLLALRYVLRSQFSAQHDRTRMQGLFALALEANRRLRPESVLESMIGSASKLLRCSDVTISDRQPAPNDLSAPIDIGGTKHWLVVSGRDRNEPFDQADRILIDALAAIGRSALANAELYRQVRFERERLASISLSIGEGVCAIDNEGRLTFVNPAAAEMIHLPSLSVPVADAAADDTLRAPEFLAAVAAQVIVTGDEITEDDVRFPARNGGTVPVSYTASPVLDGGVPVGAVITFQDITERKAHEDEMAHRAYHDSLTGLGNRRLLVDHLSRALDESAEDGKTHALIFVDVDRFKAINDSLGHVTGDDLLVAIAARINATIRPGDLLARFGGDEFTVLLEDIGGATEAVRVAERICKAVEKPLILADGYEIVASLSVGITLTEPGKSVDDVLRDADVAMYDAKVKGGGGSYKVYDVEAMGSRSPERVSLEADLRRSLERDELEVYYQPFYSVPDQKIVGCEALVRWRHPLQGLLEPGSFIGLAEETGLILPIGQFVLDRACQQARGIRDRLGVALPISVNLSPRQFRQSTVVNEVAAALDRAHLDPSALTLEITETMVMDDLASAREILKRLNRLGIRLAIDDFGTGHSSLSYLKQFPVHEVKVDRVFVQGVSEHPVDTAIVRAVVELAGVMGMLAVAEGVETAEQLAGLKMLGCPVAQGYYFSKPLPVADFDRLLEQHFGPPLSPIIPLRPGRKVS